MTGRFAAAALLALALAAAGCDSKQPQGVGPPTASTGSRLSTGEQMLVQRGRAELDPCPASASTNAVGGLPDVTLDCLGHGPAVHLSGLAGKPTVVNVWAAWCTDCGKEASYLAAAYDADRAQVRFLGVDTADTADNALSYGAAVSPPVRYPSVVDPDKKLLLGVHLAPGPPETLFVDASGRVVGHHLSFYSSLSAVQHDISTYLHVTT